MFLSFKTTYLYYSIKIIPFQEIDVSGRKAIVISVPVPQIRAFQKIQVRKALNQKLLKMRKRVCRILLPNISVLVFEDVLVFLAVVITMLVLGDLRFQYEYKIEYENNFSILVCRLHIITSHTHLIL